MTKPHGPTTIQSGVNYKGGRLKASTSDHDTPVYHRSVRTGGKDDWASPPALVRELHQEFNFNWDVAASADNNVLNYLWGDVRSGAYFGPDHRLALHRDALAIDWGSGGNLWWTAWCNPPYSLVDKFVRKADNETTKHKGLTVVMLLPARTDTRWFHDCLWDDQAHRPKTGIEVRFLKGRLKFGDATDAAPFPSMVAVLRGFWKFSATLV